MLWTLKLKEFQYFFMATITKSGKWKSNYGFHPHDSLKQIAVACVLGWFLLNAMN